MKTNKKAVFTATTMTKSFSNLTDKKVYTISVKSNGKRPRMKKTK